MMESPLADWKVDLSAAWLEWTLEEQQAGKRVAESAGWLVGKMASEKVAE